MHRLARLGVGEQQRDAAAGPQACVDAAVRRARRARRAPRPGAPRRRRGEHGAPQRRRTARGPEHHRRGLGADRRPPGARVPCVGEGHTQVELAAATPVRPQRWRASPGRAGPRRAPGRPAALAGHLALEREAPQQPQVAQLARHVRGSAPRPGGALEGHQRSRRRPGASSVSVSPTRGRPVQQVAPVGRGQGAIEPGATGVVAGDRAHPRRAARPSRRSTAPEARAPGRAAARA